MENDDVDGNDDDVTDDCGVGLEGLVDVILKVRKFFMVMELGSFENGYVEREGSFLPKDGGRVSMYVSMVVV